MWTVGYTKLTALSTTVKTLYERNTVVFNSLNLIAPGVLEYKDTVNEPSADLARLNGVLR